MHLSGGAHELLLQTENVLSGGQLLPSSSRDVANASVRCNQPRNSQDGLQQVSLYFSELEIVLVISKFIDLSI